MHAAIVERYPYLQHLAPVAVVAAVWALRRWAPWIKSHLPAAYLPIVAALLGAGYGALRGHLDPESAGMLQAALEGAIGTGLAGSGLWSLTAPMRKRGAKDDTKGAAP